MMIRVGSTTSKAVTVVTPMRRRTPQVATAVAAALVVQAAHSPSQRKQAIFQLVLWMRMAAQADPQRAVRPVLLERLVAAVGAAAVAAREAQYLYPLLALVPRSSSTATCLLQVVMGPTELAAGRVV